MFINMSGTYNGTIKAEYPYASITRRNPGSNMGNAPDSQYPTYNEVMGVFNLMKVPTVYVSSETTYFDCPPSSPYYPEGICSSTNAYYFLNELKYVLNPAAGLEEQDIQVALIGGTKTQHYQPVSFSQYEGQDAKTSHYLWRSPYIDLGCISQYAALVGTYEEWSAAYEFYGTEYIKVMVNLRRKDTNANTQNVLFVAKYPVNATTTTIGVGGRSYWVPNCTNPVPQPVPAAEVQSFCQSGEYRQVSRGFNSYEHSINALEKYESKQRVELEKDELEKQDELKKQSEQGFFVSPNPISDQATIRYSVQRAGGVTLRLTDRVGTATTLLNNPDHPVGSFEMNLDVSTRNPGMYILFVERLPINKQGK